MINKAAPLTAREMSPAAPGLQGLVNMLSMEERRHLTQIAQRAYLMARDEIARAKDRLGVAAPAFVEPDPQIIFADYIVAHINRRLNLRALLASDDLSFAEEFRSIQENINRVLLHFPSDVRLVFAGNGNRPLIT